MRIVLVLILSFLNSFALYSEEKEVRIISLTEDCSSGKCVPNPWWIKNSALENYSSDKFQPDENWKKADKFPLWMNKFFQNKDNLHTYTLASYFFVPPNMTSTVKSLGIGFGEIGEVFEVYINGHSVHNEGLVKDGKIVYHRTVRGAVYEVPKEFLKEGKNLLILKITGDPRFDHTGLYLINGYEFGFYNDLVYKNRDFISVILCSIYLVVGIYHLFLYAKRKKDKNNFLFGYWSISTCVYIYTRTNLIFENNWDTEIIQRVELIVLYSLMVAVVAFFEEFFFQTVSKKIFGYLIFSAILVVPTVFVPMFIAEYILRLWQFSALFFAVPVMIIANAKAIKKRIPSGKTILLAFTFTISSAVFDILDSLIMNTGYGFTKYTFFLFIMTFMLILARKFVELHNRTEELNLNLEHKVEERTKELKNTLKTVNDLKVQQDGDYFLTSLITEPLGLNMNKSSLIKTDIYISQKKKFEFRKKRGELGGDICVTGTLRFGTMDNRYVMFFNGDAMGKSMQGAGGAIVAGTVVNNIMSKSARNNRILTEVTPEKWLKATFNELDNAFRTFDGSMLVSGIMGLISEQTGELLYFNAEHPYLVLYRDGIADFIDKEIYLRKLGTDLIEKFTIIRFQLLPGDVLFAGSDGKDDIKMGEHKDMNEDERLFLRQVEKSRGELETLSKIIHESGEIADDLSLLKISYK